MNINVYWYRWIELWWFMKESRRDYILSDSRIRLHSNTIIRQRNIPSVVNGFSLNTMLSSNTLVSTWLLRYECISIFEHEPVHSDLCISIFYMLVSIHARPYIMFPPETPFCFPENNISLFRETTTLSALIGGDV